jgi:protein-export membrane protein SecD
MAIFVWWNLLTSPVIRSKICGWTAQIDWSFTPDSAKELVDALNDGALPAPLVLMQEEKISPTLGSNALTWALVAAAIGILAIFLLMLFMYGWKQALVTLSVLISFMVVLWLFMKLVDYALSLSWIAAVVLSIWMAVDANILIYERMREEKLKWKTIHSAIDTAYDRSRPAIRDGNISTGLIALLLFMLGSNMFKWFGTMLMVTVLLTLFVNVPLTKMLLRVAYKKD